jgi:Taurine catabolism dioxygenase TauD, TfdA family
MPALARLPISGAGVWHGRDMAASPRWAFDLPGEALAEIDHALRAAQRSGLAWSDLTSETFPLPGTRPVLAKVAEELETGSGMARLRGLKVDSYDESELRTIWFGIGVNLGAPVFQNRSGELMRAIRDEGAAIGQRYGELSSGGEGGKPFLSSYARTLSNGPLRFHTDRCDVVGLLCVRQARSGGVSKLCSSAAVHNAILARRPDLAEALYSPIWRSRFGEEAGGENAPYPLPVFGVRDGRFTSHFSLTYIEAAQRLAGARPLTEPQREAIDMLLAVAEELSFEMRFAPGDMQFLNNHTIYHGRTPFEDDAASSQDRLLLRLWLAMANSRALPEDHAILWRNVAAGALRGGIGQEPLAPTVGVD